MKIKVGVLFGGLSTEHEISIISAIQAMENLNKNKYEIIPIYISKNKEWYTGDSLLDINNYKDLDKLVIKLHNVILYNKNNSFVLQTKHKLFNKVINNVDIIIPIVHGYNTEDGNIAGYLETIGIPYAESDIYGSVVGQDKVFQKQILSSNDIPILPYVWFNQADYTLKKDKIIKEIETKIKYPVIIKPARQGSSIGIGVAKNKKELINKIEDAFNYDDKIIVEKKLEDFVELNCSVLGNSQLAKTSSIEQVTGHDEILSFYDKYLNNSKSKGMVSASRIIPAKLPKDITKKIEDTSLKAFNALSTSGVVRIDFLMSKDKNIYLNELNTIPGSLAFYLWQDKGLSYSKLLDELINLGIKRYKEKNKLQQSFDSNVLKGFNGIKGIKK